MLNRRSFLLGAGTLAIGQVLSGCNEQNPDLRVLILANSTPPQLINAFRSFISRKEILSFKPEAQLQDLFTILQSWQDVKGKKQQESWLPWRNNQPSPVANLVTLGDTWLDKAIEEKIIQPLSTEKLEEWQKLPSPWQELVKRNQQGKLDANGQVWGFPYRWGATVIAYRKDKFKSLGWTPQDWKDLWREEVKRLISVVDQPREIIGLTLKKLGYSYNTLDLKKIPNLESELSELNQQIKYYSSTHYLQPLILGDTWVTVGWSGDILPLLELNPEIEVVVPVSGTSLTADLWVQPASFVPTDTQSNLTQKWIDFCWQIKGITAISLFSNGISPMISNVNLEDLPNPIRENPLVVNYNSILANSEFLNPFPQTTVQQYEQLWTKIRSQ